MALSAQDAAKQIVSTTAPMVDTGISEMKKILAACDKAGNSPDVSGDAKKMAQLKDIKAKATDALDKLTAGKKAISSGVDTSKIPDSAAAKLNAALDKMKSKTGSGSGKADFEEDKHPRDENGQWASGSGASSSGGSPAESGKRTTSDALRQGGAGAFWGGAKWAVGLGVAAGVCAVVPGLQPVAMGLGAAAGVAAAIAEVGADAWVVGVVAGGKAKKSDWSISSDEADIILDALRGAVKTEKSESSWAGLFR
jgi:hypothetical protein